MPFSVYLTNMLTLEVEKREKGGMSAPALRRAGLVPAVVYGAHYVSTPLCVPARTFAKVLREAGEATIVTLAGLGDPLPTLIHEVDLDPITNVPRHIDFYAVTKGEKVQVAIPLLFVGESSAVEAGGNLVKVLYELEVEADPMSLPRDIQVDLSVLKEINDRIYVKDLTLPAGVAPMVDAEEVVALVQEVVEEKPEETAAPDIASIEVEKKGKEAEGGPDSTDSESPK